MDPSVNPVPYAPLPQSKKPHVIVISIFFILALLTASVFLYTKYLRPAVKTLPVPVSYEEKLLIGCPTVKSFCQETGAYKEASLSGIIKENDPIYASFDGVMDSYTASNPYQKGYEVYRVIILKNKNKNLQAVYSFTEKNNQPIVGQPVKKGQMIATSSGELVRSLNNQALIFKLGNMADDSYKIIPLSKDMLE